MLHVPLPPHHRWVGCINAANSLFQLLAQQVEPGGEASFQLQRDFGFCNSLKPTFWHHTDISALLSPLDDRQHPHSMAESRQNRGPVGDLTPLAC